MHDAKNDKLDSTPAAIEENITPRDLLKFAKVILGVCAGLFLLGGISEMLKPEAGIFEACKTILPAISTLVIGFYFGKSN